MKQGRHQSYLVMKEFTSYRYSQSVTAWMWPHINCHYKVGIYEVGYWICLCQLMRIVFLISFQFCVQWCNLVALILLNIARRNINNLRWHHPNGRKWRASWRWKKRVKKLAWNSTFKKLRSWHLDPSIHSK